MSYFDENNNAQDYIRMAEGYDGKELILVLRNHLSDGSSLLELGMGPGKDLNILQQYFNVTGSDNSHAFLELYLKDHVDADVMFMDAATMHTSRKFDGIYSNKVLIHLSESELHQSFERQKEILNPGGIILHSFWYGNKEEFLHGLRFRYLTERQLLDITEPNYEILEIERYSEMESDDSIYIVLRKPGDTDYLER